MSQPPAATFPLDRKTWLVIAALMLATVIAYLGSFRGTFVFDDVPAIVENPGIRPPWSVGAILNPQIDGGATVAGRPVLNVSFALNYALGGDSVAGYHVFNLLIHLGAGLLLFGVLRRVLAQSAIKDVTVVSGFIAALWLLHPLQTAAVTYIVQRAESLAAFWYLLAVYGFLRGVTPAGGRGWLGVSVAAGLLGGATKETLVTVPLVVLLLDRTFFAGSFRAAWQQRKFYYLSLALIWLVVGLLVAGGAGRGGTAGFGSGVSPWHYALTQCQAIVRYARLVIWPDALVFDYGTGVVERFGEVWPQALAVAALVIGTGWALVRRPVPGLAGAVFLLLLAPSSSFIPVVSQTMAEHRLYLALAVPLTLAVLALARWTGAWSYAALAALALLCGWRTAVRNTEYASPVTLWSSTVDRWPANSRAHYELGMAWLRQGGAADALPHLQQAIALQRGNALPVYNLGVALARLGRRDEARAAYEEAVRLQPEYADALNNLGTLLLDDNRAADAAGYFARATKAEPGMAIAHHNLASALLELGNPTGAIAEATEAARLDPADVEAYVNWGNALAATRQMSGAEEKYAAALRLRPDYPEVHNNLANILAQSGRGEEAVPHYREALRLRPDYEHPRLNLTRLLLQLHRRDEAIQLLEAIAQARPGDAAVTAELARVRATAQ